MIAGIDVGAAFHVLHSPTSDRYYRINSEDMEKLLEILKEEGIDRVVLEPTGSWSIPLIRYLYDNGIKVYLVHTTRFRRFAASRSNTKDDKKDARLLTEYGKLYEQGEKDIVLFEVNDAYIQSREMWKLWKEREALQKLLVSEENRLREQLYQLHPALGKLPRKRMLQVAFEEDDELIVSRAKLIAETLQKMKVVEERMKELVERLPRMKEMIDRIMTIPHIGFITAYFIAMQIVDINRFNKRSFRAFVGVGRKKEQSGISKDRTKAAKSHRTFRKLLWMAALRVIKAPEWNRYYMWQLARVSVGKKAIWRVVSKLVNIIYGVLRNGPYDATYVYEVVSDEQYEVAKKLLNNRKKSKKYKMRYNGDEKKEEKGPAG